MARMKSFITMTNDDWIPKYSNLQKSVAKWCTVLVGTTNEEEFLRDPTGNTRYLPLNCSRGHV